MTDAAVEIEGLRKTYRDKSGEDKVALKGIDLRVPRGSFFGLLGPNGAGKSTMINIMAGLTVKSQGVVRINGHDIDAAKRQARMSIGVVPQELVLDTFFTVRQALEITAGYYGIKPKDRRTQEIIDAMGLTDKADINARRLSGGMRRRLLVGKALVHNPPVLILDEPTAGVDVELRTQLWDYIRQINKAGTTVLLTTHYLEEAEELCDEIAIINHGEIIARDTKHNLMRQFDSKELILTLETELHEVPENLQTMSGISVRDGKLAIQYQPSEVSFDALIQNVKEAGYVIRDLSTEEVDLEDVFVNLTTSKSA